MERSRRDFLKISGLCALGLGVSPVIDVLATDEASRVIPNANALVGSRWAMVVDTAKCQEKEDCTQCIDRCHFVHNVPDFGNPKDEIKWIWKEHYENTFPSQYDQYVGKGYEHKLFMVLCNHCANPACVRVCPTKATWKREDGIVMMDMHRCIGCRFCMAACPYGSRSFNYRHPRPYIKELNPDYPTRTIGVVEKCDFCAERLAVGLIPACVEACDQKALIFGDLDDPESEVRKALESNYTIRRKPELGTLPQVYYIV
jgi:Fe-S-cluster-containing dehydrogenase component